MGKVLTKCKGKCIKGKLDKTPDEVTGLSAKERALIRDSWAKVIKKDKSMKSGIQCFIQLFQTYPYLQDYFIDLKDMNEDELKNSPILLAHSTRVMHAVGGYVNVIENGESLTWSITEIAKSHRVRNVKTQQFEEFGKVFVLFLKSTLGPKTKPEVTDAWENLMKLIVSLVEKNIALGQQENMLTRTISEIEAPSGVTNDELFPPETANTAIADKRESSIGSTANVAAAATPAPVQASESRAFSIRPSVAPSESGSMASVN